MAEIGKLAIKITADTLGLVSGLKSADGQITTFSEKAEMLVGKLRAIGPAATLAGAALVGAMVRSVANTADELIKLSAKTGIAVEDLSRLQYAAGLSGVSNEALAVSLTKLSKNMAEAAGGTGEATKAFDAMGISVKNSDGSLKSQRQVIEEVAEKFQGYSDGAEKSALAQRIFGRSGADLIPLLNSGAKGLKAMADESDRLGNTISTKTAKAAEEFNDNITRLDTAIGGISRKIAGPLIQSLAQSSSYFIKVANDVGIARASLITFGAAVARVTGTDEIGKMQSEARAAANAINLTGLQIDRFSKLAEAGVPGASKRVEELRMQMDALQRRALAATDQLKSLADEAYKPVQGAALDDVTTPPVVSDDDKDKEKEAKKAAEEAKKRAKEVSDFFNQVQSEDSQRQAEKLLMFMDGLKQRAEALRQSNMSEYKIAEEKYALEAEQLLKAKELLAMTEEEYSARLLQIRMDRDEAMMNADILMLENEQRIADERVRINQQAEHAIMSAKMAAASEAVNLLGMLGSKSKVAAIAAIALGKGLAIAQVIQNTAVAQMRALAELGPLAGPPAAAQIGVYGKVQAGIIAATGLLQAASVGSGGGGIGGSTTPVNQTSNAPAGGGLSQSITIQGLSSGDLFSGDAVRTLIDKLIDAQRNGARIVIA